MNFKKYHVSKNLWDEEYPNISPTIKYVPLYVGEGSFTLSSTTPLPPNGAACLFFFSGSVDSGAGPQNRVYHENPRTVDSIDGYVTIAYRITSYDARDYTTMLNSGSTPLPYEPYSSEVWHDIPHYIHNTSTDTITTLPANIYPNDTIATVGLKGQTTQSSIPSPTSPVMPQGTGERTGNLYGGTDISGSINNKYYKNDFVYANLSQGIYTLAFDLETTVTDTYSSSIGVGTTGYSKDIQSQSNKTDGHFVFTFTIEAEDAGKNLYARFARFSTQVTITYTASNIMLNSGSTALPYEPYGYKIPISSASTTTPVYLGEVQTTRKIRKLVLTGDENWGRIPLSDGSAFYTDVEQPAISANSIDVYSTHYKASMTNNNYVIRIPNAANRILIFHKEIATITDFKSYLAAQYAAGTPVCVWYVLATPQTAVVNEPLRKIGDYADEISGITIPTIAGANTFSVGTTVQPSEVTVNYKGWHPVQSVHERESNYTIATMQALTIAQLQTYTISDLQGGEWS